ncbi:MAG: hypothetical protein DI629_03400 [Mesorhizobium amorphae]|nr:MAG: hypothetical protein DI629_03400 [Mesorhizobium amorphae]
MMRVRPRILAGVLAALLASTAPARSEPITAALFGAAFAATTAGAIVSTVFSGIASLGLGLLKKAFAEKPVTPNAPGIKFDIQMGDDGPMSFPLGSTATSGTRKYIGTWGKVDGTPNAFLVDVIQIADLPLPGRPVLWVNGEKCTILWDEVDGDDHGRGHPVLEFCAEGDIDQPYLFVQYRDGTETTPSAYLRAKFGSDPERPWQDDMIGRGAPHLILTARVNRDLFKSGLPNWLVEPPPLRVYDLRQDSTVGGSGPQRWADPSTWAPSLNPVVNAYNVIRGIYYGSEWVFGGQNLAAFRLPAASWMAAANECDAAVGAAGGGTRPQFRCGMEVRADMEPLDVVEEFKKACAARITEVGGIFKILVGAPPAAVFSFTDGDVVITKGQSLSPFPPLDDTQNGIEATYPEPAEAWATKPAPGRYVSEHESADGNRRLVATVSLPAVPYGDQVQQLQKTMLEDERRHRVHSLCLPPEAWVLEPAVDVVSWTSTRNGYVNKKFLLDRIVGERNRLQEVVLREIDPADYAWSASEALPVSVGPTGPIRPGTQLAVGLQVFPDTIDDNAGVARRPTFGVQFPGDLDDVTALGFEARLATAAPENLTALGDIPYGDPTTNENPRYVKVNAVFPPATDLLVRFIYRPGTPRATSWTGWLPVTTPDIRLGPGDFYPIDMDALAADVKQWFADGEQSFADILARLNEVDAGTAPGLVALDQKIDAQGVTFGDNLASTRQLLDNRITQVDGRVTTQGTRISSAEAAITGKASATALSALQTTVRTQGESIAAQTELINGVDAKAGEISAFSLFRAFADTSGGGVARLALQARVSTDNVYRNCGIFIDVNAITSNIVLQANKIAFLSDDGTPYALFAPGGAFIETARIRNLSTDNISIGGVLYTSLASGAISIKGAASGNHSSASAGWVGVADVFINNVDGNTVFAGINYSFSGGAALGIRKMGIFRNGTLIWQSPTDDGTGNGDFTFIDNGAPSGSVAYGIARYIQYSGPSNVSGIIKVAGSRR